MHDIGNTGNRTGSERKIIDMPLGHVVEVFMDSWSFRFGENIELKLTDWGIVSLTGAIKVHETVNFGLVVYKADSLLYN